MAALMIWLFVSHSLVMAIGLGLIRSGSPFVGTLLFVGIPALRVALRFRPGAGYRLIGRAGQVTGNMGDRGGFASRTEHPGWFKTCLAGELAVIGGIFVLFVVVPMLEV